MRGKLFLKSIKTLAVLMVAVLGMANAYAQTRSISGTVVDGQNLPVIGASVMVVGQSQTGTVTDLDGKYALNVPAGSTISVSCIGYETQTIAVGTQSVINVVLKEDSEFLEETVVIGYGVQKKSDLTGAIASVKDSDLANRSTTSAAQALQGKAAGVQIVNTSGAPGTEPAIQIRGYSSNSKTTPLIIVDGLKVSDMNYLDPDNIASIEVLRDAASAAIYGIEAGNGVILVTTKNGQDAGSNGRVFYNFMTTTQQIPELPPLMNTEEYLLYRDLMGMSSREKWDGQTDTYWPDYMFEKGRTTRHTVGAQGSSDKGNMYVAVTYLNNDGIVITDKDSQKRLTGQINAEYKINKWLTLGTNNSIEHQFLSQVSESAIGQTSVIGATLAHDPITPWSYSPGVKIPADVQNYIDKGQYPTDMNGYYLGMSPHAGTISHPYLYLTAQDKSTESFNLRGTTYANITPLKGLVITSRFGYRAGYTDQSTFYNPYVASSVEKQDLHLTARESVNLFYQWENFANYNVTLGKHNLSAMAGFSYQMSKSNYVEGTTYALTADLANYKYLEYSVNTTKMATKGVPSQIANMSYYGRLGWSYANKYMIQANFRADAYDTSKLDLGNRWGYFPSVSGGWTISNEDFMLGVKDAIGLSFMKLRASWGINGNVNAMGSYQYANSLQATNNDGYDFTNTSGRVVGISPKNVLPNPDIKWETARQLDLGLDLRFFQERLTATIDWYNKNTHDLITSTDAPANTGTSTRYINAGMVNNHGTEVELGWKDSIGDFNYSFTGNFATLHNMVKEGFASGPIGQNSVGGSSVTYFEAGHPLWYLRLYEIDAVDQQTGEPHFVQRDDNPALNDGDRFDAGNAIPDLTYGATLNLEFKGFDLIVYGSGAQGVDRLLNYTRQDQISNNTLNEFVVNAWQSPSSTGYKHPKPTNNNLIFCSTDRLYDASFFKIKQIQLGYTIPQSLTKKIGVSNFRVYASLDDWFTFTKYPGYDPEISGFGGSASQLAIDSGSYPITKKIVFGVNVAF